MLFRDRILEDVLQFSRTYRLHSCRKSEKNLEEFKSKKGEE